MLTEVGTGEVDAVDAHDDDDSRALNIVDRSTGAPK